MTRQLKIFWTGMLIYAVSFFLFAVGFPNSGPGGPSPLLGIYCACFAIANPLQLGPGSMSGWPFEGGAFAFASLVVSGWINPVFAVTAFLDLTGQYQRAVRVLRIIVLAMIPFCWIFFHFTPFHPREGHFAWVLGMVIALCSHWLAKVWDAPISRQ